METVEQSIMSDEEVAVDGSSGTKDKSDWSINRRASIKMIMAEKKSEEGFDLEDDVYALISICPVLSFPFMFAIGIVLLKLVVYSILATGIDIHKPIFGENKIETTVVKLLLIPVSVAMQEDLMSAFYFFANATYSDKVLAISKSATKSKLYFSYILRTIDGFFSLYVNFTVMLTTSETLGVFLNFAALQFLQSIDDVFYELIEKGFMGDSMEHWAMLCEQTKVNRRHGDDNRKILCFRISWLDSILTGITIAVCFLAWVLITAAQYSEDFRNGFYHITSMGV